jgi:transcriptional regulator with XRE-family HTH domain
MTQRSRYARRPTVIGYASAQARTAAHRDSLKSVPARRDPDAKAETVLARVRMARGVTQEELADAIGISLPTYRRLERKGMENPGLRYLVNAALALGVELDVLIEDEWREWMVFDESRPEPPPPDDLWRRPFAPGLAQLADLRKRGLLR